MVTAKQIGNQATNARRVSSSIKKILDAESANESTLTKSEKDLLIKAANILSKIGAKKKEAAASKQSEELRRQKLTEELTLKAKAIINTWSKPSTVQEKIAYIMMSNCVFSVKDYLDNGLPSWKTDSKSDDWMNLLNEILEDSINDIAENAAYLQQKPKNENTLHEIMNTYKEKIESAKRSQVCIDFTKRWTEKVETSNAK